MFNSIDLSTIMFTSLKKKKKTIMFTYISFMRKFSLFLISVVAELSTPMLTVN